VDALAACGMLITTLTTTTNAAVINLLPVSYSLLYSSQQRHRQSFPIYITQTKIADKKKRKKTLSGQTAQQTERPAWPRGHTQLPVLLTSRSRSSNRSHSSHAKKKK